MRKILTCFVIGIFLVSCTESKKELSRKVSNELKRLDGGRFRGGKFRINEVTPVAGINPQLKGTCSEWRIGGQIYEGLVKYDSKNLRILPCLAESWKISDNGKTYIFNLRKGVKFQKDKCFGDLESREVTAKDFYFCLTKLCENNNEGSNFELVGDLIVGAKEYRSNVLKGGQVNGEVKGLRVLDDYIFSISITEPSEEFLKILGTSIGWVFPREALEYYEDDFSKNPVGTGPFKLKSWKKEENIILLERNEHYWNEDKFGNKLPYLNQIEISFIADKREELVAFKRGRFDMIYQLPVGLINEVIGKFEDAVQGGNKPFKVQTSTSMGLRYYQFNLKNEMLSNKFIRKAFNYAIDRDELVTHFLKGEGAPAIYGIVPSSFVEYPSEEIQGFEYNPELARKCLIKGGIKKDDLPINVQLRVRDQGELTLKVAYAIKQMIKTNLNIDLIIVNEEVSSLSNDSVDLFLEDRTWIADFPDPSNFMRIIKEEFWNNSEYEINGERVLGSVIWNPAGGSNSARINELKEIDQKVIKEALVVPLYYNESIRLLSLSVENFPINSWEYRDFSEVFFNNRYKR